MSRLREGRSSDEKAATQKMNTEAKARSRAERTTEEKNAENKVSYVASFTKMNNLL